jgi:hypothetical protein
MHEKHLQLLPSWSHRLIDQREMSRDEAHGMSQRMASAVMLMLHQRITAKYDSDCPDCPSYIVSLWISIFVRRYASRYK